MKTFNYLNALMIACVVMAAPALPCMAQTAIEAKGKGLEVAHALQPNTDLNAPIYFYYISKGNETRTVEMTLKGPGGAAATLEVARLRGAPAQAVIALSGSYAMQLRDSEGARKALRLVSPSASAALVSAQGECTPEQLEAYRRLIEGTPELAGITPEQYCERAGGGDENTPTPPPSPDGLVSDTVLGLLQKNTCGKATDKYLVRMKVDLSKVASSQLSQGSSLGVSFREIPFRGSKASSIKPSADGMYRGQPLLLMSTIAPRSEGIFQTRWTKNGVLARNISLPIFKYAPYRHLSLACSLVGELLAEGGVATFDLTDGKTAYSVCFKMRRERQVKNGYPAMGD
jgi:hypothetical protein